MAGKTTVLEDGSILNISHIVAIEVRYNTVGWSIDLLTDAVRLYNVASYPSEAEARAAATVWQNLIEATPPVK
jgi:hypothetical protein